MRKIFLTLLFFTSCAERHFSANDFPFHDNGGAKPKVAIVPVVSSKAFNTNWDLSEELTETITENFLETKQFYITKDFAVLGKHLKNLSEINPLLEDLNWLYENASSSEFIVFIELVDHLLTKLPSRIPPQSYTLDMAFRVHVLDIRTKTPKLILQELREDSFHVSIKIDYSKDRLGKTAFHLSPLGIAHKQMCKELSKKIQDYILLAKI
jgi:hypothetical protein